MTRRSLFAALAAPFVAKALPLPWMPYLRPAGAPLRLPDDHYRYCTVWSGPSHKADLLEALVLGPDFETKLVSFTATATWTPEPAEIA